MDFRFFLKGHSLCYLQSLGFSPLILLASKHLKAVYLDLYKFSSSTFCNDEDNLVCSLNVENVN